MVIFPRANIPRPVGTRIASIVCTILHDVGISRLSCDVTLVQINNDLDGLLGECDFHSDGLDSREFESSRRRDIGVL